MLESKIEQLTAAVIAMTQRLDRFNAHFEYVLEQQGKQEGVSKAEQHTPTPPPTTPPVSSANDETPPDYTALRAQARKLCIRAVTQKKMNKAAILEMFAQYKEGCDVVDDLPNDALTPIIDALKTKGVTEQ